MQSTCGAAIDVRIDVFIDVGIDHRIADATDARIGVRFEDPRETRLHGLRPE